MKIKHLIIVSLLLAILTFGAVSAADDADTLAADDTGEEQIIEAPADNTDLAGAEESDDTLELTADDLMFTLTRAKPTWKMDTL